MRPVYTSIVISAILLLTGCSSPFVLLVNPKSGQSVECSGTGRGLVNVAVVSKHVDNCVQQYEKLGYVRADNLTEEQKQALSIAPPSTQHRTEPSIPAFMPAPMIQQPAARNCTSSVVGNQVYTNCY